MIYLCSHSNTLLASKDEILEILERAQPTNSIICFTSNVSLIIPLAERQGLLQDWDRNTCMYVREDFEGAYELTGFHSSFFLSEGGTKVTAGRETML